MNSSCPDLVYRVCGMMMMQFSLQETVHKLLTAVEQVTQVPAGAIVRNGRFASFLTCDRTVTKLLPSNAIDSITAPLPLHLADRHFQTITEHFNHDSVCLYPVQSRLGQPVAVLCFATQTIADTHQPVIQSIAQTLGVLIDTLECANQHASRSLHDALTHLPNQAMFFERLRDELAVAHRTNNRLGMMTIDLDGFAEINAQHGRDFGDRVLQRVAARLHHAVRRSDLLARLGEDEFALMALQLNDQPQGAHVASRMLKVINQPMEIDGIPLKLSASVGIAVYPCDGVDTDTLKTNSHAAMHRAKIRGQNQFEYYTPQMNADAMERLELESRLRLAIDKNQLILHYQPIVDRNGHVSGVEALVRWMHPEQGMISPTKFIPIAEQTGMIVPIGTWVMKQAMHQAAQWALQGLPLRMNVNVSTLQFFKDDFTDIVADSLQRSGLDASSLELELTESMFIMNESDIARKLQHLRDTGVRIAIDDFGSGYSNLSRLHNLPIDTLKIDRAFVSEITVKESATPLHHRTAVLRAMATLGNSLGLRLVAEGVESEDEMRFLKRVGYEAMQGYYFAKPLPADRVVETVRAMGLAQFAHRLPVRAAA